MARELEASGHIAPEARKQREMNVGGQLALLFLFILAIGWYLQYQSGS